MIIAGLQKLTLIDFPDKLAATVFLAGCPFRCPWCYSPELVLPEKIKKQPKISEEDFFNFLSERRGLLEGVTICGGEPTINNDLPDFAGRIRKLGFAIKIDTNGTNPAMIGSLIDKKLVDYIAMDIKAPLTPKSGTNYELRTTNYEKATGAKVDLRKIRKSVDLIKNSGVDYEFRSTILPKVHSEEDIINMAKWIKGSRVYYLQNFRPEKTLNREFERCESFSREQIEAIRTKCNKYVLTKLR